MSTLFSLPPQTQSCHVRVSQNTADGKYRHTHAHTHTDTDTDTDTYAYTQTYMQTHIYETNSLNSSTNVNGMNIDR